MWGRKFIHLLNILSLYGYLERDVPELRRGTGWRWRSSGLDEASQCVQCGEVKDRRGPGTGGRLVLAPWMASGLGGGAGHIHLGQGRQIEQFVQQ